ncbi:MAG: hypothetical protein RLZZ602_1588 [Pseudomonadota bacterium]|jgi:DNA anti-recombination protein RmuC
MVAEADVLMNPITAVLKRLIFTMLPYVIGFLALGGAAFAAWNYVSSIGYKAQVTRLQAEVSELQIQVAFCESNRATIEAALNRLREANQVLIEESERVKNELNEAKARAAAEREAMLATLRRERSKVSQSCEEAAKRMDEWLSSLD